MCIVTLRHIIFKVQESHAIEVRYTKLEKEPVSQRCAVHTAHESSLQHGAREVNMRVYTDIRAQYPTKGPSRLYMRIGGFRRKKNDVNVRQNFETRTKRRADKRWVNASLKQFQTLKLLRVTRRSIQVWMVLELISNSE